MATIFTLIILTLAYAVLFAIHGAMLLVAMYLAEVSSTWRGFFVLNFVMTFPFMFLPLWVAMLVAGLLFWCLVFKLTFADGFFHVAGMLLCLNLIGWITMRSFSSYVVAHAQQHENDSFFSNSDFAKEFERGFWEGYNWGSGNAPKKEDPAADQPIDTSGLTIAVFSHSGEPVAILSGTIRNRGSRPLNGAVISYDFKQGDLSGFGTVTVGPFGPNGTAEVNQSLSGVMLPATANQDDFVTITAES